MKICPTCERNNSDLLQTCMYCGASLQHAKKVLVSAEDVERITRTILVGAPSPDLNDLIEMIPPESDHQHRGEMDVLPMLDSAALNPVLPAELLSLMECIDDLDFTETQLVQGQLEQLHVLVTAALKQRVTVRLRWPQKRWVLYVQCPDSLPKTRQIARALSISAVEARQLAVSAMAKTAAICSSIHEANVLRNRYLELVGEPAVVISRGMLLECPTLGCLRFDAAGWWVTFGQPWLGGADQGAIIELIKTETPVWMWVEGTVTVQHYRRSGRELVPSRKQLIEIVDLHTGSAIIRLTDQLTEFSSGPLKHAFGRLKNQLRSLFPQAIECPGFRAEVQPGVVGEGNQSQDAWPDWEAHSRALRVLHKKETV